MHIEDKTEKTSKENVQKCKENHREPNFVSQQVTREHGQPKSQRGEEEV